METSLSNQFLGHQLLESKEIEMAVTLTPYSFESFSFRGRSLNLISRGCRFPETQHSIGLRCVDGFMINVLFVKNRSNHYGLRVWLNSLSRLTLIDAPRRIAETLIFSLTRVDALLGMGLRAVVAHFADSIYTNCERCVDLRLETLILSGLSDELPTDWVKSD